MVALIDADSLIYSTGFTFESKDTWNQLEIECGLETDPEVTFSSDLQLSKNAIDAKLESIAWNTGADKLELWLTGKGNFRYDVLSTYKGNRVDSRKPQEFSALWEYLISEYDAQVAEGYEADDMVVHLKNNYPDKYILCAIDKDVLYQSVGSHYNYGKDLFVEVDEDFADYFQHFQAIAGDVTDGYIGCKGVGAVGAVKALGFPSTCQVLFKDILKKLKVAKKTLDLLPEIEAIEIDSRYKAVVDVFESKGFSEADALVQEQMASMKQLQSSDSKGFYIELYKNS